MVFEEIDAVDLGLFSCQTALFLVFDALLEGKLVACQQILLTFLLHWLQKQTSHFLIELRQTEFL